MITFDTIRQKCQFISENSQYVKIDPNAVKTFAKSITYQPHQYWIDGAYDFAPGTTLDQMMFTQFLTTSINFCFWRKPKWSIEKNGKKLGGSLSLITAFNNALKNNLSLLSPEDIDKLTFEDFQNIMQGTDNTQIPLLSERYTLLKTISDQLKRRINGSIQQLIQNCNEDCTQILNTILTQMSGFDDIGNYNGIEVPLLKRAQLAIADFNYFYNKYLHKSLKGIEQLTAFPDYKIPQTLRDKNILIYNNELAKLVDNNIELPHNSNMEIEIRANTIHAVELLSKETELTPAQIDDTLWLSGQTKNPNTKPYHKTISIYY